MSSQVSVCIPTCDRPQYLRRALESALNQSLAPHEVIIGDDSSVKVKKTKLVVESYQKKYPVRYLRNDPPLGESGNVDKLFRKSEGKYIVLLHDDDRLLENHIEKLISCFDNNSNTIAAFGRQHIINPNGNIKWSATKSLNNSYRRTSEHEGIQPSSLRSAITQQFPGDGYMVRADIVKKVGYNHQPKAGDAHDFTFGIQFAKQTEGKFCFVDDFTAQYCISEESQTRGEYSSPDNSYRSFKIVLEDFPDLVREDEYIQKWLRQKAPAAVMEAARHGHIEDGLHWFFGKYHRRRVLTMGGIRRLLVLLRGVAKSWLPL